MVIKHSMTYPFSSSLKLTLAALFIVAPVSSTFRYADDLLQGKIRCDKNTNRYLYLLLFVSNYFGFFSFRR